MNTFLVFEKVRLCFQKSNNHLAVQISLKVNRAFSVRPYGYPVLLCIKSLCFFLGLGYIIYYSTDVNAEIHDWVIEPVVGNRLTHQIQELTLDTPYYFKIQARNSKGMGPMSEAVQFRTPKGKQSRASKYLPPRFPNAASIRIRHR